MSFNLVYPSANFAPLGKSLPLSESWFLYLENKSILKAHFSHDCGSLWTLFTIFYAEFAIPNSSSFPFSSNLYTYLIHSHPRPCSLVFAGSLFFSSETLECCVLSEKTVMVPTPALAGLWVAFTNSFLHSSLLVDSGFWSLSMKRIWVIAQWQWCWLRKMTVDKCRDCAGGLGEEDPAFAACSSFLRASWSQVESSCCFCQGGD